MQYNCLDSELEEEAMEKYPLEPPQHQLIGIIYCHYTIYFKKHVLSNIQNPMDKI
jgi:hypothetical protein